MSLGEMIDQTVCKIYAQKKCPVTIDEIATAINASVDVVQPVADAHVRLRILDKEGIGYVPGSAMGLSF